jgi:UDP-N-acetylglucosamine--N-acetylmuramyl-(pentapeptide) pyrophosphoryl-undecaprenol N-acetylglucosamine transferase
MTIQKKKVLISAGGTGGHLYPALALAQQLKKALPSIEILFVGGKLEGNPYFDRHSLAYKSISCAAVSTKCPFQLVKNIGHILTGISESRHIIKEFQPHLLVGFGSYHTFPAMAAAKLCQIPLVLYAADSHPGKVIRLFSRFAVATAIQFQKAKSALWGKTEVVRMPLREGFRLGTSTLSTARDYFQLDKRRTTLLVFGGSQGSSAINKCVAETFLQPLRSHAPNVQVIHLTGNTETTEDLRKKYNEAGFKAYVANFETRMDLAWQAANLVISRAGAATIAEQIEFQVPGILIPYPHASEAHQEKNAWFMAESIGGGKVLLESDLTPHTLSQALLEFFDKDERKIQTSRDSIEAYKKNHQPKELYSFVLEKLLLLDMSINI